MRITLRKAVLGSVFVACTLFLNVVYLGRVPRELCWLDSAGVPRPPATKEQQHQQQQQQQHGRRPSNFWRSNQPVDSGDTRSLLDVQLRRKRRSAKSVYDDRPADPGGSLPRQDGATSWRSTRTARPTELDDIFISVKTTKKFHENRLRLILDTWFVFAKDQTYFFTDTTDPVYSKRTNGHLINTNCSAIHNRQALCCKMAQEYDTFMDSKKRWFCHVDDDTYVNVPQLVGLLQKYRHTQDWYLGKPSLKHPIEILDRDVPGKKIAFWFATGGAGFCISRALALKMMPYTSGGRLLTVGEKIRLPDDCTIGYIIGHLLKKKLTVEESFHSHLEALWLLKSSDLKKHVTFSYSHYGEKMNIVNIHGFSDREDPTRIKSIHCFLFPYLRECSSHSS